MQGLDVWTLACQRNPNPVSCPEPDSPDYDLSGSGPNLFDNMVGFGQKSGIYWMFNADDGSVLWSTVVGPGSTLGGIEWGTATDGKKAKVELTKYSPEVDPGLFRPPAGATIKDTTELTQPPQSTNS